MKKTVSVILALTVFLSLIPSFAFAKDITKDSIIYLDFENALPEGVKAEGDFTYTEGVEGAAGLFNGENAYLVLPDTITENVTDFTISAWVKFNNIKPNIWQRVFDFGNENESNLFLGTWQWEGSRNVRASVRDNGQPTSFGVYDLGEWVHYTLTQENGKLNLYINGRLMASSDASASLKDFSCTNNYLGYYNKNTEPTSYFNGEMDEFFFAPFALSASEINDIAFTHLSDEDKALSLLSRVYLTKKDDNTFSYFTFDDSVSSVSWTSSHPELLTVEEGVKTTSPTLCDVTLTAHIVSGEVEKTIKYSYVVGDFSGQITARETTLEQIEIDSIRKNAEEINTDKTYLIKNTKDNSYLSQKDGNLSFTNDKTDPSALWRFYKSPKENNTYTISNLSSGKCLNIRNHNKNKGAEVLLYQGGKGINELWYVINNNGKCGILSYMSEWFFCDDFTLKGLSDYTDWEITETENTLFTPGTEYIAPPSKFKELDENYYYAIKCDEGYLTSDLTKTAKTPSGEDAQWALTNIENEYYIVTNRLTGKNLNIAGHNTNVGANVITYAPGTSGNEQFSFEETAFGTVITSRINKNLLTYENNGLYMTKKVNFWRVEKLSERPALEKKGFDASAYLTDYTPAITEEVDFRTGFIHPGILITKENITLMQRNIREGKEPWASSFEKLATASISSPTVRIYAYDSNADTTSLKTEARLKNMRMDSRSVVNQALMYVITGNEVYRENTMTILRMWSRLRDVYVTLGSDRIDHGEIGFKMAFAAELMKYSSTQNPDLVWTDHDNSEFCEMLETIQPKHDSWWYWMNQHGICNMATIANAIFQNDMELYKLAVQRTTTNPENGGTIDYTRGSGGAITQIFRIVDFDASNGDTTTPTLVHAEMGRDQGHAYGCLGSLALCAQMLHTQNTKVDPVTGKYSEKEDAVNLFQFADERLLQAASYIGKYNLGYDVMHPTIDVGSLYNDINDTNRGLMYPAFGILYNYYKYEEKVDMSLEKYRYLKEAHEYNLPEGFINDFYIGFSDMLFAPSDADYPFIEKEGDSSTTWQVENFTAVNSGNAEKCDGYAKITLNGKAQIALTNGHYPPSVRNNVILKVKTTSDVNVTIQNEHTVNAPFVMGIIPDTNGEWKEISFPVLPQGVFRQRIFFLTFAGEGTIDVDYMKFTN
ncbi:MAG: RICIN domain-containing protein [Clostridia bacterium]|nr:RICIN domain-containing protein [Clostridia bacterium]